jgi:hypothetical protein
MSKRRQSPTTPSALTETKRCAIYTRKSTTAGLEQDFNSLDAQREACEQYIRSQASLGWQLIPEPYDDGGFSGDFLHGLAAHLEQRDSLVLVGSGPRGIGPLIPERNALPMKGFLAGKTRGNAYRLVLYLAAFELRKPEAST